jgi:hypothetical protein
MVVQDICVKENLQIDEASIKVTKEHWYSFEQTEIYNVTYQGELTGTYTTKNINDKGIDALIVVILFIGFLTLYLFNKPVKEWMEK